MLFHFCSGGLPCIADGKEAGAVHAQSRAASEMTAKSQPTTQPATVDVQRPWGRISFQRGFPSSLILDLGSKTDLIGTSTGKKEFGQIEYTEDGRLYSTLNDDRMEYSREKDVVVFRGHLRNRQGAVSRHEASYTLTWTVSDLGHIRLDACLKSTSGKLPGTVCYRFAFNGANLHRYYHTGFQPASVRNATSLKHTPMDEISSAGQVLHIENDIISRIIGFIRSETETLNFVPARGFFSDLIVTSTPPAASVAYVDATPPADGEIKASFYILPAPVRRHQSLRRAFTAYFTKERPLDEPNGAASLLDTIESYGCKDFIYHTWRIWNFKDTTTEVTCLAAKPERLRLLIEEAHKRDIKIILYLNLIPEETKTVWYQNNDAGRWRTEHPFSQDMVGKVSRRRDLMDLNSPFFEHRLRDLDYILDEIGADGVFIDWFTPFGCCREHDFNEGIPTNNINRLIDLISYIKGKGKAVYIHSSEETRIPFLEDLADGFATGERSWDRVTPLSTVRGIFDRWSNNKGNMGVILDTRMAIPEAEVRQEVNWALLEGLNPFGYTYKSKWYGLGPNVRKQIQAGADESSFEYADEYPLGLLKALRPYDLESMRLIPANQVPAKTDNPQIGVSAVTGSDAHILFVVNTDMVEAHSTRVRCNRPLVKIDLEKEYKIVELTTGDDLGPVSGKGLVDEGFELKVPPNTCLLPLISPK